MQRMTGLPSPNSAPKVGDSLVTESNATCCFQGTPEAKPALPGFSYQDASSPGMAIDRISGQPSPLKSYTKAKKASEYSSLSTFPSPLTSTVSRLKRASLEGRNSWRLVKSGPSYQKGP